MPIILKQRCLDLLDSDPQKNVSFCICTNPLRYQANDKLPPLCCTILGSCTLDSKSGAESHISSYIKRDYFVRGQERRVPPLSSCLYFELLILLAIQLDLRKADFSHKILLNLSWLNISFRILEK